MKYLIRLTRRQDQNQNALEIEGGVNLIRYDTRPHPTHTQTHIQTSAKIIDILIATLFTVHTKSVSLRECEWNAFYS